MKKILMLAAAVIVFAPAAISQQENEPASLTETMYLLPKQGMNKQFEDGVKAHNSKYHAPGKANESGLRRVEYGNKAGWYVWIMRGTYASLDSRPDDEAHTKDWEEKVGKYVEEYGEVDLWRHNKDLSYGEDKFQNEKRYTVWAVHLSPWEGYRFNQAMEKVSAAFKKMGTRSMLVFNSQVNRKGGPDVGIVWGYNKFADLETDSGVMDTYEEIHGKGSWRLFLEEWKDAIEIIDEEHRVKIGM